jgi:hypothetical protein
MHGAWNYTRVLPSGYVEGIQSTYSYYVVVRLTTVFPEFNHHASFCKIPGLRTLEESVEYRILWSGYQIQPVEGSTPSVLSLQDSVPSFGHAPTSDAKISTSPESGVGRQPT